MARQLIDISFITQMLYPFSRNKFLWQTEAILKVLHSSCRHIITTLRWFPAKRHLPFDLNIPILTTFIIRWSQSNHWDIYFLVVLFALSIGHKAYFKNNSQGDFLAIHPRK